MKKKILVTAMLAGLGVASTSQAVFVSPEGTGQVLLFPYYTVQNGFNTSIHVVNTTNQAKAVKVRILEGKNSQEVLDFNLYLSPYDVWAGAIDRTEDGALIRSVDTSCIAPRQLGAAGVPLRNLQFVTDDDSGNPDRLREGYVELIEMGVLTNPEQIAAVTHGPALGDAPLNCNLIRTADFNQVVDVDPPSGGLFGSGHLIAVQQGLRTSYDAVALDAWSIDPQWTQSASLLPRLAEVFPPVGEIIVDNNPIEFVAQPGREIDAVSAVLTQAAFANEYSIDAARDSKTDWVITFPTKRFYVNRPEPLSTAPFQNRWNGTTLEACHEINFEYFDREEQSLVPGAGDFSPTPIAPGFNLCKEVNTLTLYRSGESAEDARLFGAESTFNALAIEGFEAGWMDIGFAVSATGSYGALFGNNNVDVIGLPVIGFSAMSNVVPPEISGLPDGVLSSFLGSTTHKGTKLVLVS